MQDFINHMPPLIQWFRMLAACTAFGFIYGTLVMIGDVYKHGWRGNK